MIKFYDQLKLATSEEDVKDAYIRELGLTRYNKGKVDILTDEVWFEAKMGGDVSYYEMFTQLLHYIYVADKKGKQTLPILLAVIDQQKAGVMLTSDVIEFLRKDTIKWGKSASKPTPETVDEVSKFIGVHFVRYNIKTHTYEFRNAVRHARQHNEFPRKPIRPNNLKQVFDVWVDMVGREITSDESKYAELFFADIMSDGKIATHAKLAGKLIFKDDEPAFFLGGKLYELGNVEGYRAFWDIYNRPPEEKFYNDLLARRDSLIPLDERMFKGAFFTPLEIVDKAYDILDRTLGEDWQKDYFVWDMCCGVGNLEVKHSNHRKIFMSTLDEADVNIMESTGICVASGGRFQYDYLNDDITHDGEIDYTLTNKIPADLQKAIKAGKKILVLMNPPYAEATNSANTSKGDDAANKAGVAQTRFAQTAMQNFGASRNELFVQFLARIAKEMPTATIAMFSKLKHINAPNFETFRQNWNAKYLDGFIVHSKTFDGLKGDFPIGFLIWQTYHGTKKNYTIDKISTEILNGFAEPIRHKDFYNLPSERMLNNWIDRPRANNTPALPLKNAISPATSKAYVKHWSDDAIAYMMCNSNDLQNASTLTALASSCFSRGHGFYVTPDNLDKAAMTFTARLIIKHTWINDRDQFLMPTGKITDEFKNDCLIWMLFSGRNLTAGADGLKWDNKKWSLVNHFIPFVEPQVNAPARFESDFMVQYLKGKKLSAEAESVMEQGQILWQTYFSKKYSPKVRDQYKLDRPDVGWYQIRQAIKEYNKERDTGQVRFTDFNESYQTLSDKLRPMVFDLGFLPR